MQEKKPKGRMKDTKKLTTLSITVTIAMALSFLESQIPAFVAVPGVKEAAAVSFVRVALMALLFGNFVSMLYSIAGAILSLSVMVLFK